MDFLKKATGGSSEGGQNEQGGSGGGFMDKLNSKAGGGKESEKDEDMLDKGKCLRSIPFEIVVKCHRQPTNGSF